MEEELTDQLDLQHSDDESQVPAIHNKLLGAVSQLYEKKRVKAPTRKEPSLEVSEFHLSQLGKKSSTQIKVTDLAKVLNKRATHVQIGQKLKAAQKRAKTLPKPLEKIHADRVTRAAGYEHAKHQLNRWDAFVYKQKVAEQLTFPLKSSTVTIKGRDPVDYSKMFRKPTELELKLSELEKQSDPLWQKKEEDQTNQNEGNEENYPLSLAEVIEKRKMMAKLRAQQSYKQAKAIRHSKIKSKKFHQIQRRARVKEQLREFEELQKKDPEAALKKLEELERTRAEERVTLRHRSTGQWAKNLAVRAKYDKDARIALAEQLAKSRELTVKIAQNQNDSESEKEEEEQNPQPVEEVDPDNPWVLKPTKEMEEFISGYRKYWNNKGKELEKNETIDTAVKVSNFQLEAGQSTDKQISDEESSYHIEKHKNEGESKNYESIASNKPNCTRKIKFSLKKNVFTKVNKDSKHIKPLCKTGSWTITEKDCASVTNSSKNKKSKKIKCKEHKSIQSLGHANEVTESKFTDKVMDSSSAKIHKTSKVHRKFTENIIERVDKVKSLDDLFEDMENVLQNKAKVKLEKMRERLKQKRNDYEDNNNEIEIEKLPSLELKKRKIFADFDEELLENSAKNKEGTKEGYGLVEKTLATASTEVKQSEDIDPHKFLKVTPRHLSSKLPDIMTEGDEALDDEEATAVNRHLNISEAFAEDDIVDQFQKDKEEEVKKNIVGDVDLTLPGWGSWGGHNMKTVSRRKRKKFVIKFPKAIPRRDASRYNVIINEDADKPVKQYQVSEIPFPFTSVKEYEASIRAPLGSTWVSQIAHQRLIQPPVITQMGAVINPIDETHLVQKDKQMPTNKIKKKKKMNKK